MDYKHEQWFIQKSRNAFAHISRDISDSWFSCFARRLEGFKTVQFESALNCQQLYVVISFTHLSLTAVELFRGIKRPVEDMWLELWVLCCPPRKRTVCACNHLILDGRKTHCRNNHQYNKHILQM